MPVKSDKLGPGTLSIGATGTEEQWAAQLTACSVEPSTDTEDSIPVLSGEEIGGDDTDTAELTGTILQSYDAQSLLLWAHTHRGQELPFTFTPNNDAALQVSGIVKIRRLRIGGDVKTRNTSEFTFPIVGDYDLELVP
jgi:hypothetical protein